ncbi:MAG TPA: hypothetical protein VHD31_00305 [Candidatus Paceibacterota bacterium]|nr:hypothetical protein [Candidatus Paceibacterota bacterium]
MRTSLIALSLLAASTLTAHADDGKLLWKSTEPTGYVTNGERCYATLTKLGKHTFYNPMDCKTPHIRNYFSMSWTVDEPPINMKGVAEAHHVKVLPNGNISLY